MKEPSWVSLELSRLDRRGSTLSSSPVALQESALLCSLYRKDYLTVTYSCSFFQWNIVEIFNMHWKTNFHVALHTANISYFLNSLPNPECYYGHKILIQYPYPTLYYRNCSYSTIIRSRFECKILSWNESKSMFTWEWAQFAHRHSGGWPEK